MKETYAVIISHRFNKTKLIPNSKFSGKLLEKKERLK